jgi:6-phosphogluconate dehydrogenase
MDAFVRALSTPRRVILLVPAGKPVDSALEALGKLLEKGDTVIDMGNEWYQLTETRQARMAERGINYMGCARTRGRAEAEAPLRAARSAHGLIRAWPWARAPPQVRNLGR